MYISVSASMSFIWQKGEFDRCFNRLDRPVGESRPDRQPDRPVDPTGAGRPGRFPSLIMTLSNFSQIKKYCCPRQRTGHFRGLEGFEAKAKAKDFRMCS